MAVRWQDQTQDMLKRLVAGPRMGLITDVDGTISEMAQSPDAAFVTERSKHLLSALVEHLPLVAALSGRAAADIHQRVGVEGMIYVGNHGFEQWIEGHVEVVPEAAAHRAGLEAIIREVDPHLERGMFIEDKGATLSLHYRQADDPPRVRDEKHQIMLGLAERHNIELFEGRMIFEFRPPVAINKGTAFTSLVERYALDTAIYIGDDVTDVDAFHAAKRLRDSGRCFALACGVAAPETPALVIDEADIIAQGVSGVESLLDWMLTASAPADAAASET